MPANIVKSYSDKTGKPVAEVEKLWTKAKEIAKKDGRKEADDDFYSYVVGILKHMLGINESDGQAATTTSSSGLSEPVPASGSGLGTTQVKIGDKPMKRKRKRKRTFKEYVKECLG